jgi:multidrug efflux pump subunit AcrA (membrane-fusion protein)
MRFLRPISVLSCLLGGLIASQAQITIAPKQLSGQNMVELYAQDAGVLETMGVAVGDQVSKGQVLAKLDDEKHVYNWRVALLKADNQGVTRTAQGEMIERGALLAEAQERLRRRQISEHYVRSLEGRLETTMGRVEAADLADKIADLDLEIAKNALQRRYIRSTVDGVVVAIGKPERSKVGQGDAVITVADLDNLSADLPLTPELLVAFQEHKSVPVIFGPGKEPIFAQVINVKQIAEKKKGEKPTQVAQLIFPSLLPQPFDDAVSVVDTTEEAAPTPPPTAPKSKS